MKHKNSTDEILNILKTDPEIKEIFDNSEILKTDIKDPQCRKKAFRVSPVRTKDCVARDMFWRGIDGVRLRMVLSSKYDIRSNIKDPLLICIQEYIEQRNENE